MTAIEIILIVIGVILMMGSFFVTEKLSQKEVEQISQLSSTELKHILERNMKSAEVRVEELVDDVIDRSMEIADRALEKETNMKINEISEYAETVLESIHKNHNEVMFLYSMLNEKHSELTEEAGKLEKLKRELHSLEEDVGQSMMGTGELLERLEEQAALAQRMVSQAATASVVVPQAAVRPSVAAEPLKEEELDFDLEAELLDKKEAEMLSNNNRNILNLHEQGFDVREIAKQLGLGVGEVKLVIDLYKEGEA